MPVSSPDSGRELLSLKPPMKRLPPAPIKPVILSFHLRWRERRIPQVENHFLLSNALSGDQQIKMSARKRKQRSKVAGRQKARFSFQAQEKKQTPPKVKAARGDKRGGGGGEEPGKESDVSRSSTPVQDEIPPEMLEKVVVIKEESTGGTKKRGRPRKMAKEEDGRGARSRSSTPVLDETAALMMEEDSEVNNATLGVEVQAWYAKFKEVHYCH